MSNLSTLQQANNNLDSIHIHNHDYHISRFYVSKSKFSPYLHQCFVVDLSTDRAMRWFEVRVGEEGAVMTGDGYGFTSNALCKRVHDEYWHRESLEIECVSPQIGHVISIHLVGGSRSLNICELVVF